MDPFDILGIPRSASEEEIKTAYRKLARRYHPDGNADPEAYEKMRRINEAYELIKQMKKNQGEDVEDWEFYDFSYRNSHGMEEYQRGSIFQRPMFRWIVLLLMIGSMLLTTFFAAFMKAGF
ncbi:MAG: DnaJ domain-containing protein [Clostridiales bacterium]|nr:DnaJ domain-containing protein [Candidatus Blautia equi]